MQEALETWSKDIMLEVCPRCLDIIEKLNERLVKSFKEKGLSEEAIDPYRIVRYDTVRMANLGIVMSKSVNGVAKLHTKILKSDTFSHWYNLMPEKFNNKTNGITPRRWLVYSNRRLSDFISKKLGSDSWKYDLSKLKGLEKYLDDEKSLKEINEIKYQNKKDLADYIRKEEGISIDPNSIFDIQIKR